MTGTSCRVDGAAADGARPRWPERDDARRSRGRAQDLHDRRPPARRPLGAATASAFHEIRHDSLGVTCSSKAEPEREARSAARDFRPPHGSVFSVASVYSAPGRAPSGRMRTAALGDMLPLPPEVGLERASPGRAPAPRDRDHDRDEQAQDAASDVHRFRVRAPAGGPGAPGCPAGRPARRRTSEAAALGTGGAAIPCGASARSQREVLSQHRAFSRQVSARSAFAASPLGSARGLFGS